MTERPMPIGMLGSFGVVPPPPVRGRPARSRFVPDVPPSPVLGSLRGGSALFTFGGACG
jgi:hypothetical protein